MAVTVPQPVTAAPAPADPFLRRALLLDAGVSAAVGAAYVFAATAVETHIGSPAATNRVLGLVTLAIASVFALIATRPTIHRAAATAVAEGNVLWVIASVVVVAVGVWDLTTLGTVWILGQAAAVGSFAALQAIGLRRSRTLPA